MSLKPTRIDVTSGAFTEVSDALRDRGPFDTTLLAEGDSWFDLFTPLFQGDDGNLLGHIRTTRPAALVDISRIGDTVAQMTTGWQRLNTRTLLNLIRFDAWLLSAGGNDLKDAFAAELSGQIDAGMVTPAARARAQDVAAKTSSGTNGAIASIVGGLDAFVAWRDASRSNAGTPIFIHGYDLITPRDAPSHLFPNLPVAGPWIYPVLQAAGMHPDEMAALARRVIGQLQSALRLWAASHTNVFYVDLAGTLTPAAFGDVGEVGDWADEIHPSRAGFAKLGQRFNAVLAAHGL